MRQNHVAGDKAFVDYSGKRIGIVDPTTGEIREAEIFVAVLGASNLTYAEATWTQQLADWTGAHIRMFRFFGGAPRLLVPKSEERRQHGVVLRSRDQPHLWRDGRALCRRRSSRASLQAARQGEGGGRRAVRAELDILGRLRHRTFFSLAECNAAITLAMQRMNERPMRKIGVSRRELFEQIERDALQKCPTRIGSSRSGGAPASIWIITSRSTTSSIRFLTR